MTKQRTIIYKSEAVPNFSMEAIEEMLFKAKRFNSENRITGFILFANRQFVQLIEGEEKTINQLYKKIQEDIRHQNVAILLNKENDRRIFPDWFMSFYNFSNLDEDTARKRLLLESFLSRQDNSEQVQQTVDILRSGIHDILLVGSKV